MIHNHFDYYKKRAEKMKEKKQHIRDNLHVYKERLIEVKKEFMEFLVKRVSILSLKQDILGEYEDNNTFFKRLKACQSITLKHRFSVFNALNSKAKLNAKEQGILQSFGSLYLIENAFNLTKEEKDLMVFLNKECHRFVRNCQKLEKIIEDKNILINMVAWNDKKSMYYKVLLGSKTFIFTPIINTIEQRFLSKKLFKEDLILSVNEQQVLELKNTLNQLREKQ
ncbi:hypothetical protein [Helicobacter cetorum]|uniref:hypothetical protein n=1 Tax=Helicobacter cetorum TaxID=138563 RepID=UPI000CF12CAC|nr:hypothetical protein [Helicobacter cetorum]